MALIYVGTKSAKKQNKKAGWKKEQEEYEAWLAKHGVEPKSKKHTSKSSKVVVTRPVSSPYLQQQTIIKQRMELEKAQSQKKFSEKLVEPPKEVKIHDPRVLYKDNPEMLERELKARERKFLTAPAYNKGGDMLVTPELMKDIVAGGTRRRG